MVTKLHSFTTKERNRRDNTLGRTGLWHNYRETLLTHQRSYLARLHYVHQNAAHHGLVRLGSDWKWCSAAAFKKAVSPAWVKTITSFNYDEIAEKDGDNL
jgi:putative transposase